MRLEVLNLSRLENEKVWTFSNMACRRFLARPAEACAPKRALKIPRVRLMAAMKSMMRPVTLI